MAKNDWFVKASDKFHAGIDITAGSMPVFAPFKGALRKRFYPFYGRTINLLVFSIIKGLNNAYTYNREP